MRKVDKPWGHELIWAETKDYVGKILHIEEGEQLSLQYHEVKEETLFCQSGRMELQFAAREGDELDTTILEPGQAFHVPTGMVHRNARPEHVRHLRGLHAPPEGRRPSR